MTAPTSDSVETLRSQLDDAAKHIGQQRERIKALEVEVEEARHEGFEEGYTEGASDQSGWAVDTAHAVLRWLDKEGDGYDIHHPDGNTTDAIIQGLYDAKRIGNLEELRKLKAALAAKQSQSIADELVEVGEGK